MSKKIGIIQILAIIGAYGASSYLLCRFTQLLAARQEILYLLLLVGIAYVIKEYLFTEEKLIGNKWCWFLAICITAITVTGVYFSNDIPFEIMDKREAIRYGLSTICFLPLMKSGIVWISLLLNEKVLNEYKEDVKKEKMLFFVVFFVILGCWILVWLAYYPGLWNYDPWQVDQVLNKKYNEFHPLIHTLLLGKCYELGMELGEAKYGVILYDYVQMIFMAGVFAYTYCYIQRFIPQKWGWVKPLLVLFYAVCPINSIMAISTTKDTIFTGLVLLCFIYALQIMDNREDKKRKQRYIVLIFIATILMLLFRNNAVYAYFLLLLISIALCVVKKCKWKVAIFICINLLTFQVVSIGLQKSLEADLGSTREFLSVPSQQFGRIYENIKDGQDEETLRIVEKYFNMTSAKYNPYLADSMKGYLNIQTDGENTVGGFLKDSIKLLIKYPVVSLDAYLYLTDGYWNINSVSFSSLYGTVWDGNPEHRYGYLLTTVKPGYNIIPESKIPLLENFMEHMISANEYQKYPIVSLLLAPSLYLWITLFCTIVFYAQRKKEYLFLTLFLDFMFLTLLLGPCVLVRYVYPYIVCTPVLICLVIRTAQRPNLQ